MKAVVFRKYGSPDALQLEEVEKPVPKDDEVLIEVHASSVNDWDWQMLRGIPFVNRMMAGLFKPSKIMILGCDVSGRVEAVGKNVTKFKPGDEVLGDISQHRFGGFAEYVCAGDKSLRLKPEGMSFEQAAALPQAAALAVQGFRDITAIKPGQKILINGAGGGAGSFAVQIAKALGAEVTGVDSTVKLESMSQNGADHVMDYTKEEFTENGERYDLIQDNAAHHSFFHSRRSLNSGGTYAMLGGPNSRIFQMMLLGPLTSMFGSKKMGLMILKQNKNTDFYLELFKAGKVAPLIDKTYPLSETVEAFRYFGKSLQCGKIVISVKDAAD